jgi:tRNA(adenine34) deaminase
MVRRYPTARPGFLFIPTMEQDDIYMREALKEARYAASEDEVPVGAVIVCRGRIIGKGHNMTERLNDPTAHAEMIAITAATEAMGGKYLNDCTLYVTVEPCPMCAGALAWSQIGRVVYGASDPKRGFSLFSPSLMHPKTDVVSGILAKDCSDLVTEFFRNKRNQVSLRPIAEKQK